MLRRCVPGLALACALGGAALAQSPPTPQGPQVEMPFSLSGEEISYATRAESLLRKLSMSPQPEIWLRGSGFEEDSKAVAELLALAEDLRPFFEPVPLAEALEAAERHADDDEGFLEWQRQQLVARATAAGEALGAWLESRRADGYPPELLVERLLKNPLTGISWGSTDSLERLHRLRFEQARAFETGLRRAMRQPPRQFRATSLRPEVQ